MRLTLVGHASVIVDTGAARVWTDPWLLGKAFNDSWSLAPAPVFEPANLDRITHLWISHEHPDHFHIPTLKSLPDSFKRRVIVLFQQTSSQKMFEAFSRLGFANQVALRHRHRTGIAPGTDVYCYQEGLMNSALAIASDGQTVLNVNDAELRKTDCRLIRRDIGATDVVLNQFSLAGYNGSANPERDLPPAARSILATIVDNHINLGAMVTVPFASFMYFSTSDNMFMNSFANTPADVVEYGTAHGVRIAVLYPGETMEVGCDWDNESSLERFAHFYESADWIYDDPEVVPLSQLMFLFGRHAEQLAARYPRLLLQKLPPVTIRIPDLDITVRMSLSDRSLVVVQGGVADVEIRSQPLAFLYQFPFGSQTLGVSARLRVFGHRRIWRLYRILYALNNAELYLKPRYLLKGENLSFARDRLRGGARQLGQRLQRG